MKVYFQSIRNMQAGVNLLKNKNRKANESQRKCIQSQIDFFEKEIEKMKNEIEPYLKTLNSRDQKAIRAYYYNVMSWSIVYLELFSKEKDKRKDSPDALRKNIERTLEALNPSEVNIS